MTTDDLWRWLLMTPFTISDHLSARIDYSRQHMNNTDYRWPIVNNDILKDNWRPTIILNWRPSLLVTTDDHRWPWSPWLKMTSGDHVWPTVTIIAPMSINDYRWLQMTSGDHQRLPSTDVYRWPAVTTDNLSCDHHDYRWPPTTIDDCRGPRLCSSDEEVMRFMVPMA